MATRLNGCSAFGKSAEASRLNSVASNIGDLNRGSVRTGETSTPVLSSAQALSTRAAGVKTEVAKFLDTVRAA